MPSRRLRIAVRRFGPFESAIRKQWALFESARSSGYSLDLVSLDLTQLKNTLFDSRSLRDGAFDIAFIVTDWVRSATLNGDLLDLSPYIRNNPPPGYPSAWAPSMLRLQNIEGKIAGLPYHDGPECLIYRKDLFDDPSEKRAYFEKFGEPLQPPATWEQFGRVARYFHRPADGLYSAIFAAYPDGHNTVYDFFLQLWTRGGDIVDADGNLRLNTVQARDALKFYRALLTASGAVHPRSRELDSVASGEVFARGEAAMMVNWFNFAAQAHVSSKARAGSRVEIAAVPSAAGFPAVSLNVYWVLSIASGSSQPDLCYDFLRHCATPEMDKLLTLEGGIGCRKSTWSDEEVNTLVPFYRKLETIHGSARELPHLPHLDLISTAINNLMQRVIDTTLTVEYLLREAERNVQG